MTDHEGIPGVERCSGPKLSPDLMEATSTEPSRLTSWEQVTTALLQTVSIQLVFKFFFCLNSVLCVLSEVALENQGGVHIVCVCSVAQLCPTLCDPEDRGPLSSSVHEIFQARMLEWVTIFFSKE